VGMSAAISELVRTTLLILGALFPIINPPENVPFFLTLTTGLSPENRSVIARKIAIYGFALLIVSLLVGTHILAFFGISLPIVQVGGGLVLVAGGWKLLNRTDDEAPARVVAPKQLTDSYLSSRAFYPLTLPLTVGPGSISVAIALGADRPVSAAHWPLPVAAFIGCAIIAITIYIVYRFAEPIGRALGETAMKIFVRLSAFILLCIGVQIVWNGASKLLSTIS
jgi:multiple antibiotic resistance protein